MALPLDITPHAWEFEKVNDEYHPRYHFRRCFFPGGSPAGPRGSPCGEDPVKYLREYAGRCPTVHVKDFKEGRQVEVGHGDLDLAGDRRRPGGWRGSG